MATTTIVRRMVRIRSSLTGFSLRLHGVAFLQGVEAGVETAGGQEVVVGAYLRDAAFVYHQDLVDVSDQPELVGYDEGCAPLREGTPAVLDSARGLSVET